MFLLIDLKSSLVGNIFCASVFYAYKQNKVATPKGQNPFANWAIGKLYPFCRGRHPMPKDTLSVEIVSCDWAVFLKQSCPYSCEHGHDYFNTPPHAQDTFSVKAYPLALLAWWILWSRVAGSNWESSGSVKLNFLALDAAIAVCRAPPPPLLPSPSPPPKALWKISETSLKICETSGKPLKFSDYL